MYLKIIIKVKLHCLQLQLVAFTEYMYSVSKRHTLADFFSPVLFLIPFVLIHNKICT